MNIRFLKSSTVIVEANNLRILMDPWLIDGEYYGSWAHYPPYQWTDSFSDIDYIYLSHIHPDHISKATMERLPKSIPVLIHRYETKFLKRNVEALGFEVRELPHNNRHDLGSGVTINIIAADDCDPELCGKFFGCAPVQAKMGSTQIDSLCVVSDGKSVLVNTNDCPYELAKRTLSRIKLDYGKVDMLLAGYSGAGPYPQCFANLTRQQKTEAAAAKKASFLAQGARYISDLTPRYVLPFAGQYTLCGKLGALNDLRGVPEVEEAGAYFTSNGEAEVVLLNTGQEFNVTDGTRSSPYEKTDLEAKSRYQSEVLSRRTFPFEDDTIPTDFELQDLLAAAFARMTAKRGEAGYGSQTVVYLRLRDDHFARVPFDGGPLSIADRPAGERRITFNLDSRLLKKILSGPRFAHWNNAEIGSHIEYDRHPNVFDRGLQHVMNFFHA